MEVKAISTPNFNGRNDKQIISRKNQENNTYPQIDSVVDKKTAKAMRDMVFSFLVAGAAAGAVSSCDDLTSASASASASAWAWSIGGNCHHHDTVTIVKRDTINKTDTIIHTVIKPIYVKEYPFHIGDSLIDQGRNIGVPVDGPIPDGSNNVVYVGSKAHSRYDDKFYESMVDSVGTNKRELSIISKIVDMSDKANPKTTYMKTIVKDFPGKGIKLTRYIAEGTDKKPTDEEDYMWNYAGYEVRTNGRDGRRNIRAIMDKHGNLVYKGDFQKGKDEGSFLYGSLIYDPKTGDVITDDKGDPEFAQYDFDQAVIYSDYVKKQEFTQDYKNPGWIYSE